MFINIALGLLGIATVIAIMFMLAFIGFAVYKFAKPKDNLDRPTAVVCIIICTLILYGLMKVMVNMYG